jgi:predicted enzyme involved in methoxymalonyl-ACP biosynthesis
MAYAHRRDPLAESSHLRLRSWRALARGLEEVVATYLPTAKNKPCLTFWKGSGFAFDEATSTFSGRASTPFASPKCTQVEVLDAAVAPAESAHAL